mmetsp:Transcript_111986/g.176889  ORF Transcript_111986/g.176889 Transcript_111986/m.176889 type:complete len:181 (+) Transcript_111986:81-623(+)
MVDGPAACQRLRAGGVVLRPGVSKDSLEVLLVSRRRVPDSYTVPAGKYEDDVDSNSFEACALRETREEAGIEGDIIFDLGWYRGMAKDKSETRTRFFAMRFVSDATDWQEETERARCWHSLDEAQRLVEWSPMIAQVFEQVQRVIGAQVANGQDLLAKHPACSARCDEDDAPAKKPKVDK